MIVIREHLGERNALRPLFELAEDSTELLDGYINDGRVFVAFDDDGKPVGHVQLIDAGDGVAEVKNVAVLSDARRRGVGRALFDTAIDICRSEGSRELTLFTATADTGVLRFYQRLGFRLVAVERDWFNVARGYPPGIIIDGIELRDRVQLTLRISAP